MLTNPAYQNKSSIILTRSHGDEDGEKECSYCNGVRPGPNTKSKQKTQVVIEQKTNNQTENQSADEQMVDNHESGVEKDLLYYKVGFTSMKMRSNDYEYLLNAGFTRCGTYFYFKNNVKSCCEVYQYKVDSLSFKMSKNQK